MCLCLAEDSDSVKNTRSIDSSLIDDLQSTYHLHFSMAQEKMLNILEFCDSLIKEVAFDSLTQQRKFFPHCRFQF